MNNHLNMIFFDKRTFKVQNNSWKKNIKDKYHIRILNMNRY